ncbi:DUF3794 domain-containing protein [Haloimpatiens sp. FM7330]|uniref:DUF3794 domain-containing protein n=1 Tax=Haloimpatiens sp. FM7330 TaxID=3298610 RepID=UPI00364567CA
MASVVREFIEYSGLADYMPNNPVSFKQISIQENLSIPVTKPDMEQIVKVMCEVYITNTRVIKTPKATSLEGQKLTGWKVIIEGEIKQKIEYSAHEPTQSLHAVHFNVPFSSFIILPEDFVVGTPISVQGYIEDIFVKKIDKTHIFKNISILLNAEFCE